MTKFDDKLQLALGFRVMGATGRGGDSGEVYVILVKEQYMQSSTYFGRRLLLVTRIRCLS